MVRLQPEAPEVLICYLNLHNLCRLTGDSTVAEDAIRKAVDFAEDIAPVDHPLRAQAYYLFANFLDLRGDSAEALEWYQRAVEAMDESPTVPDEKREKYVEGLDACRKKVDGEEG